MSVKEKGKIIIPLAILTVVIAIVTVVVFSKEKTNSDSALEKGQDTLEEMQGEESEIALDGSISEGESVDITFRFRDYKDVPDDPETLQETKDSLIPVEGNATIEIIEIGTTDKADNFHKAGEGKELYYIVYEYKGNKNNPNSLTIHPRALDETGWDPAPQFIIIDNGDEDYSGSYHSDAILKSLEYDSALLDPELNESGYWSNVWEIEENLTPEVVFKYIDMQGEVHYLEVQ